MRALAFLLLLCLAHASQAAAPARIEANFDILARGIKLAEIKEVFTSSDNRYRIESYTKPVGLLALFKPDTIKVVSEGVITPQGLRPNNFVFTRTHETERNAEAYFDWDQSTLMLTNRNGQRMEKLPPGLQDRLSVMYQFRYISSLATRQEVPMRITNGNRIDDRLYLIRAQQVTEVPLGRMETLYLRTPPEQTQWKTEIWLSLENGNFPCKVVVTEDDGAVTMQVLTALSITQ